MSILGHADWSWRPMTGADVLSVCEMEAQSCMHPLHAWTEANYRSSLQSGYWTHVMMDGQGEPVGVCVCMFGVDELHLLNIAVSARRHRQGVGRWILAQVKALCQAKGFGAIWLEVRPSNAPAQALYRSLGYQPISVRKNYYPAVDGREDAQVMTLEVTP
jgi:[ribosomal protein S18]-alanine N-acetyltransferase